jgi:hypothetical protein
MMKKGFLFTPEVANAWKSAWASVDTDMNHCGRRVRDASTSSQLQCKLWIVNELSELALFPKSVVLLGGWYANFIVPLLIEHGVSYITNFDLDPDVKKLSYKFNKTYKDDETYKCYLTNVMFDSIFNIKFKSKPDMIINTSCEHMFPMTRFKKLNRGLFNNVVYVLQSTNDDQYDDHINCVSSPEELAEQAEFVDVMYSGTKTLDNGMDRFMVIGR